MTQGKKQQIKKQTHTNSKISSNEVPIWLLAFIIIITLLAYLPVFDAGFVQWDDKLYIQDNALIRSINLKEIFSTYQQGNYHPVTMLVYAIEYHFWNLNAAGYHTVNLFLHLLNTLMVCYVVFKLCRKKEIAFVAALFFGIHPIHVESVAWLAELKDLLYTFFFLASYIYYLKYSEEGKSKFYFISLLLFLLSLLSKAMAAPLPVILLLTDYFIDRKFSRKTILEKIPFFILAIILGIVAINAQLPTGETLNIPVYPFWQRIIFACYGFVSYLIHLIMPVNLNAVYPYPMKVGENIPFLYYFYVILFFGIVATVIYSLRFSRKIFFGIGFFTATVFLVLQLLPIGDAIMANRYGYIPSVGIFYLAGEAFYFFWIKNRKFGAIVLTIAFTVFFSYQTFSLCRVWKDGLTLWGDVISKDATIPGAYNNHGLVLMEQKRYREALNDFNKAIELKPEFSSAWYNRGLLAMSENRLDDAIKDYSEAIRLRPFYAEAYMNRGIAFFTTGKLNESFADYSTVIKLLPSMAEAYAGRGAVLHLQKKFGESISDYSKALQLQPQNPQVHFNLGLVFNETQKLENAVLHFSRAIELQPDYAQAWYNRGVAKIRAGNIDAGCMDMKQAITLGLQPQPDEYNRKCY